MVLFPGDTVPEPTKPSSPQTVVTELDLELALALGTGATPGKVFWDTWDPQRSEDPPVKHAIVEALLRQVPSPRLFQSIVLEGLGQRGGRMHSVMGSHWDRIAEAFPTLKLAFARCLADNDEEYLVTNVFGSNLLRLAEISAEIERARKYPQASAGSAFRDSFVSVARVPQSNNAYRVMLAGGMSVMDLSRLTATLLGLRWDDTRRGVVGTKNQAAFEGKVKELFARFGNLDRGPQVPPWPLLQVSSYREFGEEFGWESW